MLDARNFQVNCSDQRSPLKPRNKQQQQPSSTFSSPKSKGLGQVPPQSVQRSVGAVVTVQGLKSVLCQSPPRPTAVLTVSLISSKSVIEDVCHESAVSLLPLLLLMSELCGGTSRMLLFNASTFGVFFMQSLNPALKKVDGG